MVKFLKIVRINFPVSVESKKISSFKENVERFQQQSLKRLPSLKDQIERFFKDLSYPLKGRISSGETLRGLAAKLLNGGRILFVLPLRHKHPLYLSRLFSRFFSRFAKGKNCLCESEFSKRKPSNRVLNRVFNIGIIGIILYLTFSLFKSIEVRCFSFSLVHP